MGRMVRVMVAAIIVLVPLVATGPVWATEEPMVVVEGGGWGHGVGMPQYGARGMAEGGSTAAQILDRFYTDTSLGALGVAGVPSVPDPLLIGLAQDRSAYSFSPQGGSASLCGVDVDCVEVPAGAVLRFSVSSTACRWTLDGAAIGQPGACGASLRWSPQPAVRISVPELGRTYARGELRLVRDPWSTGFHLLAALDMEQYLYGLGEMPSSWPTEALRAQAIAGRSYAANRARGVGDPAANPSRQAACGCHLYSSTLDQAYIGWAKEAEGTDGYWGDRWRAAVDATAGRVVVHDGLPILANYFSSSGGRTENVEDIWGFAKPYLRSVEDPWSPRYGTAWRKEIPASTFARAFGMDRVLDVEIESRYASGSPSRVVISGLAGGEDRSVTRTGNQIRTALGLRSHYVTAISGVEAAFGTVVEDLAAGTLLAGEFDGDPGDEVAAFDPSTGVWSLIDDGADGPRTETWATFSTRSGWGFHGAGDADGDGRDDLVSFHPASGTWWVSRSTGSAFSLRKFGTFSTGTGWKTHLVGDYDGDGRADVASFHPSNGTWWVSRSNGSTFTTTLWEDFSTPSGWGVQLAGDFDGDGRDDLVSFHPSNGTWWVSRSTGTGFTTSLWADFSTTSGWKEHLVGDFDGDGRDDIVSFHPSNGTWWVSRSTGSGFSTSLWEDFTTASGWGAQIAGDFDADGRGDVMSFHPSNGTMWVSRSTGSSFDTRLWGTLGDGSAWTGQLEAGVDENGTADVVNHRSDKGEVWVARSTGTRFDVERW